MATKIEKPWRGVMLKKDYDTLTSKMPTKVKKDFDEGLAMGDTNLLMGLGGRGLHIGRNKMAREDGETIKKDFSPWW